MGNPFSIEFIEDFMAIEKMINSIFSIAYWELPVIILFILPIYSNPFIPIEDKPPTGLNALANL